MAKASDEIHNGKRREHRDKNYVGNRKMKSQAEAI